MNPKWLPEDSESRLPHGPTHQVGIGAIITHPLTGKMLVVQEKSGPAAGEIEGAISIANFTRF